MRQVAVLVYVLFVSLSINAQILLSESFDNPTFPPTAWTLLNVNSAGSGWTSNTSSSLLLGPYSSHSGTGSMVYEFDLASQPANSWAITPSVNLTANITYAISFYYKVEDNFYPEKLKLTVGNSANVSSQSTTLWNNNGDTALFNTSWQQAVVWYKPTSTGTLYFGLNCYSNPDQYTLTVDDFKIEQLPANLPSCATLLSPANNATNVPVRQSPFKWKTVSGASKYAFYIGTNSIPDSLYESADTTASLCLSYNTKYYWSVAPGNALGVASGCPIDSFTTQPLPAVPSNDNCTSAIALSNGVTVNGTTIGATESMLASGCNGFTGNANDDVWYSFTTPLLTDATITVIPSATMDAAVEIYSGTCGALVKDTCADSNFEGGAETYRFSNVPANTTYYFRVYDYYDFCTDGDFTVTLNYFDILPVSLMSFTGERHNSTNILHWETASEQNNRGFELQRSKDGSRFSPLAFVPSKATNGNSVAQLTYQYLDENATGDNYYRLKQIDKDGHYSFSKVVFIKGDNYSDFTLNSIYPNPARQSTTIEMTSSMERIATLQVTDATGRPVITQQLKVGNVTNTYSLSTGRLAPGLYSVKIVSNDGKIARGKIIKE